MGKLLNFRTIFNLRQTSRILIQPEKTYFNSTVNFSATSFPEQVAEPIHKPKFKCKALKAMGRKFFVGGNWKMVGNKKTYDEIIKNLVDGVGTYDKTEIVLGVPALYCDYVRQKLPKQIGVAAQNCYKEKQGAFTGEISADMILDCDCHWVILGHSERRTIFKETDELIADKAAYALSVGLQVIYCIGETLQQREENKSQEVCIQQLQAAAQKISNWDNVVIAYEPVWAIGTGRTATPEQAEEMHCAIRKWFRDTVNENVSNEVRIIYGGSVTGANCAGLAQKPNIDGFLVGGASLKPEFVNIIKAKDA